MFLSRFVVTKRLLIQCGSQQRLINEPRSVRSHRRLGHHKFYRRQQRPRVAVAERDQALPRSRRQTRVQLPQADF